VTNGDGSPRVVVREPNRTALVLVVAESLEIGRECSGLLLRDGSISRRHLLVEPRAGGVLVTDLDSRNGSAVDRRPLRPRHPLNVGDTVQFGSCTLTSLPTRRTAGPRRTEVRDAIAGRTLHGVAPIPLGGALEHVLSDGDGLCAVVCGEACDEPDRRLELGPARWSKASDAHHLLVRGMVRRHRGVEAWSQGDGFMVCFRSVLTATGFARDLHGASAVFALSNPQLGRRLRMSIDLVDRQWLGSDQHNPLDGAPLRSVRLCQAARPGETLSGPSVHDIMAGSRGSFEPPGIARFAQFGEEYAFHVLPV
jgi:hypothetical protein